MIIKRLSIMLVATATVGVALLAPVTGSMARGGGSGGGSSSTHGSFPTGPNQNPNAGNSSSGSSGSSGGSGGHLLPPGVHVPPGSGSGSGHGGPNGGPGHPPR
jgi:hypothetical protein